VKVKKYGYSNGVGIPFALKMEIAQESYMDYFLLGSFTTDDSTFIINTSLYNTKNGKLIAENSFIGLNIFEIVDEMSLLLKMDLNIPQIHLEETKDLPVSEITTNSIYAFKMFITGYTKLIFENDYTRAAEQVELAVNEDPTFALAHLILGNLYMFLNQPENIEEAIQTTMQYIYKLPEIYKLITKLQFYTLKQEVDKMIALTRIRIELYPDDITTYKLLAQLLMAQNLFDEQIDVYISILKLDPTQYEILKDIGSIYEKKGKFEEALKYYDQYAVQLPEDFKSYLTSCFIISG